MKRTDLSRGLASGLLVAAGVMMVILLNGAADEPARPTLSDSSHLWNRLRQRLHARVDSEFALPVDKPTFDLDDHDPLHWSRIWFPKQEAHDYLFKGDPYREAVAVLDEFLNKDGDKLESDPFQRALLVHDLWALFDHVSNPEWSNPLQLQPLPMQHRAERHELARRLARAIWRLALTNEQIIKLPDTYAAAVASRKYPTKFDSEQRERAFLPAELWDPKGPWVLVSEWANNPLAIRHTVFFGGRSTFAVFLRLPDGRAATEKYLKELREWKPKKGDTIPPNGTAIPPQVPPRTQFALARRMMTVNDAGELVPTRVTESLQIRVLPDPAKPGDDQTFLEYRLRRQSLALSAVGKDERDRSDMLDLGPRNDDEKHVRILGFCSSCHTDQGILSMNSYTGDMDNISGVLGLRVLTDGLLKGQENATIAWKQKQYSWGLLSGLKESKSRE